MIVHRSTDRFRRRSQMRFRSRSKAASVKSVPAIPVVFAMGADPVAEGLVESLNRPGGNITGVVSIAGALATKLLELMREFLRDDPYRPFAALYRLSDNRTNEHLRLWPR